jgi:hypothetical protein
MRRGTVASIYPVGEAFLGFPTLRVVATAVVVIGLIGSALNRMKKSMFTFRRKLKVVVNQATRVSGAMMCNISADADTQLQAAAALPILFAGCLGR